MYSQIDRNKRVERMGEIKKLHSVNWCDVDGEFT